MGNHHDPLQSSSERCSESSSNFPVSFSIQLGKGIVSHCRASCGFGIGIVDAIIDPGPKPPARHPDDYPHNHPHPPRKPHWVALSNNTLIEADWTLKPSKDASFDAIHKTRSINSLTFSCLNRMAQKHMELRPLRVDGLVPCSTQTAESIRVAGW